MKRPNLEGAFSILNPYCCCRVQKALCIKNHFLKLKSLCYFRQMSMFLWLSVMIYMFIRQLRSGICQMCCYGYKTSYLVLVLGTSSTPSNQRIVLSFTVCIGSTIQLAV